MTTITSALEAAFVGEQSPFTGWIGGTDNEAYGTSEGRWVWATGPEQGTRCWNGEVNGTALPQDTYVWILEYRTPLDNDAIIKKGEVLLVR